MWEQVGGFSENLDDTAEDTVFNQKALEAGFKFAWSVVVLTKKEREIQGW